MANAFFEEQLKADINYATSGDQTIITIPSLPASCHLAIDFIMFVVAGATNIQFKDGTTSYGGLLYLAQNQAIVLENTYAGTQGVITLTKGGNFVINSSASVQVSGFVRYRLLDLN